MIGIDLIKTSRMNRLMERFGEKGLLKFLSSDEISLVKNYKTAAGFWAIKEALSKAIGTGIGRDCSFHDIRIYKTDLGAPKLALSSKVIEKFGIVDVSISITHDGEYAIGVVALETIKSSATNKIKQF
ncbi:holo-ACP synthase [Sulfurimonas aquatica]|uniref:Holo-[acyl-carrier-protein] synthase n=1 Tax=Sulfurimonas aquatica TaxID=2672570 RepID=A0A975B0R4_9BACT|nr:holo-ACP synthase [Sulfurimonas aquatica]QSZ42116.1 holo-ACP synthase [Sulfurimonas aquatica]